VPPQHESLHLSNEQLNDLSHLMPEIWPELTYIDSGEHANTSGVEADQPDVLPSILIPSVETLLDEAGNSSNEEKNKDSATLPRLPAYRRSRLPNLRRAFVVFVIIALLFMLVDGIMIAVSAFHQSGTSAQAGPELSVTPGEVHPGQTVSLQISHFTPLTQVFLTRDIQVMVLTDANLSLVQINAVGNANVSLRIGAWGPGQHSIQGEDVKTHYTAITSIKVVDAGKILPSHMALSQNSMDMGSDLQGANTVRPLVLHNTGDGSLSWEATSDQPWLMVTPTQGMFTDSESIFVAATRAHLIPGAGYHGTISFITSNGKRSILQVKMQVLALPTHAARVFIVTPPALSFVATDGITNHTIQTLMMSNAGSQSLLWDQSNSILAGGMDQQMLLTGKTPWLNLIPSSGELFSDTPLQVQVGVNNQALLPGVYSMVLVFTSKQGVLNNPQHVAVSLTISPNNANKTNRPEIALTPGLSSTSGLASRTAISTVNPGTSTPKPALPMMNISSFSLSFSDTEGDPAPATQATTLTNAGASPFYWQATIPSSASSWLNLSPLQGMVNPSQSTQVVASINIANLSPGFYTVQLPISAVTGLDVPLSNSPQLITINMMMYAPCVMQVSPTNLSFYASTLHPKPPAQSITLRESGNCPQIVSWNTTVDQTWIALSSSSGNNNATILVSVDASTLLPLQTYTAHITFTARENGGSSVQVSPQSLPVTLTVSS
jgi:hypothetical protein